MIQIIIVDDHQLVGEGTKKMIELEKDMSATYSSDVNSMLNDLRYKQYDVYLLDMNMPQCSGIELAKSIMKIHKNAKIILYTGFEYLSIFNLLIDTGISGILSKSASQQDLIMSIRSVINGYTLIPVSLLKQLRVTEFVYESAQESNSLHSTSRVTISQKEKELLEYIAKGKNNKQIADDLYMSLRAVEYNLTKIFKKLKVTNRSEALAEAVRHGIVNVNI
ncbi:competence protein ComA [Paenibacillus polymyxa]|uniref:response regulator transcription factor n=1 Tax=Paenibacillus polymyxa TaxID=1406 RepID=UPI0005CF8356|nr:response regulator transcription factor [Paenibacillus polymyxa]KJD38188.1 competence protein ComA [Paenibacillus polymyxa]